HGEHVTIAEVEANAAGLIALTGGPDGPIDQALADGNAAIAKARLHMLKALFADNLYVEVQRHNTQAERRVEPQLLRLAYDLNLPLVATNQCYFPERDDYEAHDALVCIAEGRYVAEDDRRRLTPEHYFKSQAEMVRLFADLPEAIENTVEIARRCSWRPVTRAPILPSFVATPENDANAADAQLKAEADELVRQAEAGLRARLDALGCAEGVEEKTYWERLKFELDIIVSMKFPGYFLIVADFIKWAKDAGIPVGPGRGSGAGSVVAWSLTITDLDPLQFGLLFERFLNPERVSMPDFDIDFCQDRRDEVIKYVRDKYGADRVAQIITYGKLQARAVLRDVGRVLQIPYGQVDRLCKLVPNNPANPVTLQEAIDSEPRLQEARASEEVVDKLLGIALKLEGLYRHASTHAAGVVIGDRPLTQLVPLYRDPRADLPATQYNMKWVEQAGLVKFDFLGLKTLTVIEKAVELIERGGTTLDLATLPLTDEKSYELLARGETAGVFQLESVGMRESLKKLRPDRFEDIIAMVSLYRPGPMDNIPTYIARKHGLEVVKYPHDLIAPILEETYGVIIYQEQVMQIAQELSGYSLGEADLLRRAMGKKIKEEMAKQRVRFVDGAQRNGVEKNLAGQIFDLVDKFAGYGFNKSHAAAYALLAYHTAFLKANYPVEFLSATMTLDMGNSEKLAMFADEARRLDVPVRAPSVNRSTGEFMPDDGGIRYALSAIKNVGGGAIDSLVRERESNGPFTDVAGFATRLDPKALNKRCVEMLACAGAFDDLHPERAEIYGNADRIIAAAQKTASDKAAGQNDLFGLGGPAAGAAGDAGAVPAAVELRSMAPWRATEKLMREHEAIGFYLSGHPIDQYVGVLDKLDVTRWSDFEATAFPGMGANFAATVTACRIRRSAKGNRFAFVAFSDPSGQFEAIVFADTLTAAENLMEPGTPVLVRATADGDDDSEDNSFRLRAASIEPLQRLVANLSRKVHVTVRETASWDDLMSVLRPGGTGEIQ
ncbi:MAG: DNA polymerase III subunit alpha, partial [Pseudomonadota bacterium]